MTGRKRTEHLDKKIDTRDLSDSTVPINNVIAYIHKNLHLPLELSEISKEVGCVKPILEEQFKSEMGVTIHEYILNCRVNRAKLLLSDDSLTVSCVAGKSGFSDCSHFNTVFKENTGADPSDYRITILKNFPRKEQSAD